jgi:hypothetical protein
MVHKDSLTPVGIAQKGHQSAKAFSVRVHYVIEGWDPLVHYVSS